MITRLHLKIYYHMYVGFGARYYSQRIHFVSVFVCEVAMLIKSTWSSTVKYRVELENESGL